MILIRKLHKWLGLLVSLQLLLWTLSGLVFAWLDHHEVSAEHSTRKPEEITLPAGVTVAEPAAWLSNYSTAEIYEIRLAPLFDRWVWRIEAGSGVDLRAIEDGRLLDVDEALVRRLANSRYAGEGQLEFVRFQAQPGLEARGAGPVWQAQFDDEQGTALYFSADDGRLVAARTETWRLFDFFWMLHTMDYRGRDNFNNPLVITFGTAALWLSLSGLLLLFRSFGRHDFDLIGAWRRRAPLRIVNSRTGDETELHVDPKRSLFVALAGAGVELPSNCGGGGSCGLCVVQFRQLAPEPVPEERTLLSSAALEAGRRLACRHQHIRDTTIEVPDAALTGMQRDVIVTSARFVTPFIKELKLQAADGKGFDFRAGSYVQIDIPAGITEVAELQVPSEFATDWSKLSLPALSASQDLVRRAYSMANFPAEAPGELCLNIRFALPPIDAPNAPCGRGTAYLFARRPGDRITVRGPFGTFCDTKSDREKVFIGGGAGMAPLRSIILDALVTRGSRARMSFWFGARSRRELFYGEEFEQLMRSHENFSWHVALSDIEAETAWRGPTGHIHQVAYDAFLSTHADPTACEYYLCGPPPMMRACRDMLARLGVPADRVFSDDFGI